MAKAGRNDPCPCGSGKKYKNCCMRQDRISSARSLGLGADASQLLARLYQFAQTRRFAAAATDSFTIFWGGVFDLTGLQSVDAEDIQRTFQWFVHDVAVDDEGQHVIDLLLDRDRAQLPPPAIRLLEAWTTSISGVYRVLATGGDDSIEAYDPLRRAEVTLSDAAMARNAQAGEIICGRSYALGDTQRLSMMSLLLPPPYETPLVDYVENAYRLYQGENPQADWDAFLRANGHIVNAFLLSEKGASLRSLIGPGTRYHDPATTRDRLRAHTAERRVEAQREAQQEAQASSGRVPRAPVRRTNSGIILPGAAPQPEPAEEKDRAQLDDKPRILIPGRDG